MYNHLKTFYLVFADSLLYFNAKVLFLKPHIQGCKVNVSAKFSSQLKQWVQPVPLSLFVQSAFCYVISNRESHKLHQKPSTFLIDLIHVCL